MRSRTLALPRVLAHAPYIFAAVAAGILFSPLLAFGQTASSFEVTGWIPYWRSATGTADTLPHLDKLTEVNPFVFTLKQDGTLHDNGALDQEPWLSFNATAKAKGVRVIPTVMSGDRTLMHTVLSDAAMRTALEIEIATLVQTRGYDGIDIDFEFKRAETKDHFSAFLKGLKSRLGDDKWLMCTIETRIPNEDKYYGAEIPADAGIFSNDLQVINTYCDRVRLMAYDQQGIDMKLNAEVEATGELHAPVADPRWVEKVVNHMSKDINKDKMLIGVPTYGYEYAVTTYANNQHVYDILWTFNPGYAWPIAQEKNITPLRNSAGEMYFTYLSSVNVAPTSQAAPGNLAAAAAATYATQNNANLTYRLVTWPDAYSMQTKIDLAKRLGVRGISVFKFDGGQDPAIWNTLAGVATANSVPAAKPAPNPALAQPSTPGMGGTITGSFTRGLDLRATGADVLRLQRLLNTDADTRVAATGAGSPGSETSYFGPATKAAVQKFQVKHGIAGPGNPGYGYVGPKTRAKLNSVLAAL